MVTEDGSSKLTQWILGILAAALFALLSYIWVDARVDTNEARNDLRVLQQQHQALRQRVERRFWWYDRALEGLKAQGFRAQPEQEEDR